MKKQFNCILFAALLLLITSAGIASAQTPSGNSSEPRTAVRSDAGFAPLIPSMFEPIGIGGLLDDRLVKNQPVAAAFESETVRIQPDGTRLVTHLTIRIYRDSEGRVRREQLIRPGGSVSVTIYDPVARFSYSLNQAERTAQRFRLPNQTPQQGSPFSDRIPSVVELLRNDDPETGLVRRYRLEPPRIEGLGRRQITGVDAEGRRMTLRIPAGALGNETEIESVYEIWMARDLRMLVQSRVRNPVSGEYNLRLTSLSRSEPQASLFAVPSDFTTREMGTVRTDLPPPH